MQTQVEVPLHADTTAWLPHAAPSLAGVALMPADETEASGQRVGSLFCRLSAAGKVTRSGAARGDLAHSTLIRPPGHDDLTATVGSRAGGGVRSSSHPAVPVVRVADPLITTTDARTSTLVRTAQRANALSAGQHDAVQHEMSEEDRKRHRIEMIRSSRMGQAAAATTTASASECLLVFL